MYRLLNALCAALIWLPLSSQWSTVLDQPLILTEGSSLETEPSVVEDGQGGLFVIWGARQSISSTTIQIIGQQLDTQGYALWEPGGRILVQTAAALSPSMAALGNGDFLLCWMESADNVNTYLMMQRFDMEGSAVWPQAVLLAGAEGEYADARNMNFFVQGNSAFIGYDCWTGPRIDARLSRVDLDGTLAWGYNGVLVEDTSTVATGAELVPDGTGGGYYLYWRIIEGQGVVMTLQRFNAQGELLWPGGVPVSPDHPPYTFNSRHALRAIGAHDAVVLYKTNEGPLLLARLDTTGAAVWSPSFRLVEGSDTAGVGFRMYTENEEAVVSWSVNVPPNEEINYYLQRFDGSAEVIWPGPGVHAMTTSTFDLGHTVCAWAPGESLIMADLAGGYGARRSAYDGSLAFSPVTLSDTAVWFDAFVEPSGLIKLGDALIGAILLNASGNSEVGVFRLTEEAIPMALDEHPFPGSIHPYPMPADASFRLNTQLQPPIDLRIVDAQGRLAKSEKLMMTGSIEVSVDRLPAGVYVVDLNSRTQRQQAVVVVQH